MENTAFYWLRGRLIWFILIRKEFQNNSEVVCCVFSFWPEKSPPEEGRRSQTFQRGIQRVCDSSLVLIIISMPVTLDYIKPLHTQIFWKPATYQQIFHICIFINMNFRRDMALAFYESLYFAWPCSGALLLVLRATSDHLSKLIWLLMGLISSPLGTKNMPKTTCSQIELSGVWILVLSVVALSENGHFTFSSCESLSYYCSCKPQTCGSKPTSLCLCCFS